MLERVGETGNPLPPFCLPLLGQVSHHLLIGGDICLVGLIAEGKEGNKQQSRAATEKGFNEIDILP